MRSWCVVLLVLPVLQARLTIGYNVEFERFNFDELFIRCFHSCTRGFSNRLFVFDEVFIRCFHSCMRGFSNTAYKVMVFDPGGKHFYERTVVVHPLSHVLQVRQFDPEGKGGLSIYEELNNDRKSGTVECDADKALQCTAAHDLRQSRNGRNRQKGQRTPSRSGSTERPTIAALD